MAETKIRIPITRQDDTTNSTSYQNVIVTGWGWILGNNTTAYLSETVNFGVTFASAPIVICSALGYRDTTNPSAIGDLTEWDQMIGSAGSVTTTTFVAQLSTRQNGAIANTRRVGYSWIAIGKIA